MHTLCLLDIKLAADDEARRFMDVARCIEQLLEEARSGQKIFSAETRCVGLARMGSATQQMVYGAMGRLKDVDFGKPLHSFVIPGTLHFVEEDLLRMFDVDGAPESEGEEEERKGVEEQEQEAEEWRGTHFGGIWSSKERGATLQILQNCDVLKIKRFCKNGSSAYEVTVGGGEVGYESEGCELCRSSAEWVGDGSEMEETVVVAEEGRVKVRWSLCGDDGKLLRVTRTDEKGLCKTTEWVKL